MDEENGNRINPKVIKFGKRLGFITLVVSGLRYFNIVNWDWQYIVGPFILFVILIVFGIIINTR